MITALITAGALVMAHVPLSGPLALAMGISPPARAAAPAATPTPRPTPTPALPSMPVPVGTFATRVYTDQNGASMTYYLYGPASYTLGVTYPLVLILHGGGEVANPKATAAQNRDTLINQQYVQAFAAPAVQQQWPSFVVAPQVPEGQRWVDVPATVSSYTLAPEPSSSLALAMGIVLSLEQIYPMIDSNQVYVTGISMGGFGTWDAAERWPEVFAAALPIAGAGDPQAAAALADVPIWALHGSADDVVPVEASREMVQAVRADGGIACYTEYPGEGHGIWTIQNLDAPQLLSWLFSQTKAPISATPPLACPPGTGP